MFTTGEFSKIARVTRRTLRHYREIGLFNPVRSDRGSGYHFYSIDQLPRLHRILALKDLGFSLEQIRRMTQEDINVDELRGMLQVRKADIEQAMLEELERIRSIESRLQLLEEGLPQLEVIIKSVPEQHLLSSDFICTAPGHGFEMIIQMARLLPPQVGEMNLGTMVTLLHTEDFEYVGETVEIGYYLPDPTFAPEAEVNGMWFRNRTLPAVETMATVVVTGMPDFWHMGSTSIGVWMEHNNYQIAGPQREVWHRFSTLPEDPPTVELQIPVIQRETTSPMLTD